MAEELKVRLVRCPKCRSLIKEHPEYSVYQCGSCSVVLRAKKKEPASDGILDKSINEKGREGSEKMDSQLEKETNLHSTSDAEITKVEGLSRKKERIFSEEGKNFVSVSSRIDKKKMFLDDDKNVKEHRHKHTRSEKGVGHVDNYLQSSKKPLNHRQHDPYQDLNMNRSRSVCSSREGKVGDYYSPKLANFGRSLWLKGVTDMQGVDRDGFERFRRRSLGTIDEQERFSALRHPDEGPSNYRCASGYGYSKPVESCLDIPTGVQDIEEDRARLLKKLDELRDKLSRSHKLPPRPRELVPMASTDPFGGSIGNDASSAHHQSPRYHHVQKLAYRRPMNDDDYVRNLYRNFHPASKHVYSKMTYGDVFSPGMQRRPHHPVFPDHKQQRTYGYSSKQYLDFNEDHLAPYSNADETLYHLPACSCLHCHDRNWKGKSQLPPADFTSCRFSRDPLDSTLSPYVHSDRIWQHYLPTVPECPQLNYQDPPLYAWPSDIESDVDGFGRRHPRRLVLSCKNKQLCRPIANASPFIMCYNCLEVLKLPKNFRKNTKNDQRLRCGACSTHIVFKMENKRLILIPPGKSKRRPSKAVERSCFDVVGAIPSSSNVENLGYNQKYCKEEKSPDNVIDWRDSPGSSELPFNSDVSLKVSSLPFQEQVNNASCIQIMSGYRNESRSKVTRQDKVSLVTNASQVVPEKNDPVATEMEVPFSGYQETSSSQDSLAASNQPNQQKLPKGMKSFLVGFIKKSFRDFSRSNDNIRNDEGPNVLVNGQPLSDSVVKKG